MRTAFHTLLSSTWELCETPPRNYMEIGNGEYMTSRPWEAKVYMYTLRNILNTSQMSFKHFTVLSLPGGKYFQILRATFQAC